VFAVKRVCVAIPSSSALDAPDDLYSLRVSGDGLSVSTLSQFIKSYHSSSNHDLMNCDNAKLEEKKKRAESHRSAAAAAAAAAAAWEAGGEDGIDDPLGISQ
jgi:hypothetical protein